MFELTTPTKGKLLNLEVLSKKDRDPNENPGAQLKITFDMGADMLALFDSRIANVLYEQSTAKQQALDGIQALQLTALAKRLGAYRWSHDMIGYELTIDLGLGGARSNLVLGACKMNRWKFNPKEGGAVTVGVTVESADVSATAFGQLAKLKSCEISFTLTAAEVTQSELDTKPAPEPTKRGRGKGNDPTSEFIERNQAH